MKKDFAEYVKMVEAKEMTVGAACEELGISRQTWYNRKNNPSGTRRYVKRSELAEKVDRLETENAELIAGMMNREQSEWLEKLEKANEWIQNFLNQTFRNLWCNLRFEHVDAAAYWYTFELKNDSRRQTWSVRHSDLEG